MKKYNTSNPKVRIKKLIDSLEELIKIDNISAQVIREYINQINECKQLIKEEYKHIMFIKNINGKLKSN